MKNLLYKSLIVTILLAFFQPSENLTAQDIINLKVTSPDKIDWDIDALRSTDDFGAQITEDFSGKLVKATDGVTAPTDNDTWSEVGFYACDSLVNPDEIAGNIAFISRGACQFCTKAWNAQKAGATGVVVGNRTPIGLNVGTHIPGLWIMNGTFPECDSVTIPVIFISYEDRLELERLLEENEVQVVFEAKTLYDPTGPDAYMTPIDQVKPLDLQVMAYPRGPDTLMNVEFFVEITDPNGGTQVFSELLDTLLPGKDWPTGTLHNNLIQFEADYTPAEVGMYTMTYTAATPGGTHPLDEEVLTKTFRVTDYTFATDNGVVEDKDGMQINEQAFSQVSDGIFDVGSYFYMGPNGGTATHASFAIANPVAMDIGLGFEFTLKLYPVPTNGDGIPMPNTLSTPVASVAYALDGSESSNDLIYVEFPAPILLSPDSIYCLMVESGGFLFSDQIPAYTTAGGFVTPNKASVYRFGDEFESSGFEYWHRGSTTLPHGGRRPMVRLHMQGFDPALSIDILAEDQFEISPTISKDQIFVKFKLNQIHNNVMILVTSIDGQRIYTEAHDLIRDQTITLDVHNYPAGTYFLTVNTPEGLSTKKFVVLR